MTATCSGSNKPTWVAGALSRRHFKRAQTTPWRMPGTKEPSPTSTWPPSSKRSFQHQPEHHGCTARHETEGVQEGKGSRQTPHPPTCQRGGEPAETRGALGEPIRMQMDAEKTSSKPLSQGPLLSWAQLPMDAAPVPTEPPQVVQLPLVHVLHVSPSRPLEPQFSAMIICKHAAEVSLSHQLQQAQRVSKASCCSPGLLGPLHLRQSHAGRGSLRGDAPKPQPAAPAEREGAAPGER